MSEKGPHTKNNVDTFSALLMALGSVSGGTSITALAVWEGHRNRYNTLMSDAAMFDAKKDFRAGEAHRDVAFGEQLDAEALEPIIRIGGIVTAIVAALLLIRAWRKYRVRT